MVTSTVKVVISIDARGDNANAKGGRVGPPFLSEMIFLRSVRNIQSKSRSFVELRSEFFKFINKCFRRERFDDIVIDARFCGINDVNL